MHTGVETDGTEGCASAAERTVVVNFQTIISQQCRSLPLQGTGRLSRCLPGGIKPYKRSGARLPAGPRA